MTRQILIPVDDLTWQADIDPITLGPVDLVLPSGSFHCHDAIEIAVFDGEWPDRKKFMAIVAVAEFGDHGSGRLGVVSHMTPSAARHLAAALIDGANLLDAAGLN